MHEYLRAVGFSGIQDKEELNRLLDFVENCYQKEQTVGGRDSGDFSERKKAFAPRMGIMLRGEYDEKDQFQREYYYPYFEGKQENYAQKPPACLCAQYFFVSRIMAWAVDKG